MKEPKNLLTAYEKAQKLSELKSKIAFCLMNDICPDCCGTPEVKIVQPPPGLSIQGVPGRQQPPEYHFSCECGYKQETILTPNGLALKDG